MKQATPFDRWVAQGDAFRDAGQPSKAAEAYRRALNLEPGHPDIRVQLGNMLKDAGRLGEAEDAYRAALAAGADTGDTNVQLGRALRRSGKREAAYGCFIAALRASPNNHDAVDELVSLGEFWTAQRHVGLGASTIADVVATLNGIKQNLARIEQVLPQVANLAAIPPSRWDLWRQLWQVPPAPVGATPIGLVVLADPAPAEVLVEILAGVEGQRHAALTALVLTGDAGATGIVARRAAAHTGRLLAPFAPAPTRGETRAAFAGPADLRAALDQAALAKLDWIAVAVEPVVLHPEAIGWLASAALAAPDFVAAFADDDELATRTGATVGVPPTYTRPTLRSAADPELLEQGQDLGAIILARRAALIAILDVLAATTPVSDADPRTTWWVELHRRLLARGRIAHVNEPLSSRLPPVIEARRAAATPPPKGAASPPALPPRAAAGITPGSGILAVVPSRGRADLLAHTLSSLRATAEVPGSVSVLVVAARTGDDTEAAAMTELLARYGNEGWLEVAQRDEAFDRLRFANAGAAARTGCPILLFATDDLEMSSFGWDQCLRQQLGKADVGAVGARLIDPARVLLHAGLLLGTGAAGYAAEGLGALPGQHGPEARWRMRRSVAAVSGVCLACRRSDFLAIDGFDAQLPGGALADVDLCLKLAARGLRIVYEPQVEAILHATQAAAPEFAPPENDPETAAAAAVMRARWGDRMTTDPYFNTHYARWGSPFAWLRAPTRGTASGSEVGSDSPGT